MRASPLEVRNWDGLPAFPRTLLFRSDKSCIRNETVTEFSGQIRRRNIFVSPEARSSPRTAIGSPIRRAPAGPLRKNKHLKFFPAVLRPAAAPGAFWCRGFDRNPLSLPPWCGFDPRDSPFGLIRAAEKGRERRQRRVGGVTVAAGGGAYAYVCPRTHARTAFDGHGESRRAAGGGGWSGD